MKSKLILALDVEAEPAASQLVRELRDLIDVFKVGSQLFTLTGPRVVEFVRQQGRECFLDLKFHDIPHTVAKAVQSAAALGARMLTLHTLGGEEMLRSAAAVANRPLLLGVTVLTSVGGEMAQEVSRRAQLAHRCGLDGVVASATEAPLIRRMFGPDFLIVTPGIRPTGVAADDQRRVVTPAAAIRAGANYLVVGRPILAAPDPRQATVQILEQMRGAE